MSFFSKQSSADTYGAILDIGSGSVLAAIVHSNVNNPHPIVVWSHREHVPLRSIESLEQVSKSVITALMNVVMELDSAGRKVLTQYNSGARIKQIQSSISAPWSYTVTKSINYTQEKPFMVTQTLIDELIKTTEAQIASDLKANTTLDEMGLSTITTATVEMLANGYRVNKPTGSKATELSVSRANVVAQKSITQALDKTADKIYAHNKHKRISFMLMAHSAIRDLLPHTFEMGIVDVTYEATELGIVRDGALQYCTHTPFGSFSLARELAEVLKIPLSEAFGYLHTVEPLAFLDNATTAQKTDVEKVFEAYISKIEALFKETGDELSVPKTIALHVDLHSEPLFLHLIEKAAKRSTKTSPVITLVTEEILKQTFDDVTTKEFLTRSSDTALLLSAMFFHKHHDSTTFTYL